jgi:outer membrane protein TolC
MPFARALSLALAVAALAGCRHVSPQPLSADATADRIESRSLADPGLRDFLAQQSGRAPDPWPQPRWDLRDLTLAALYFSPELHVARAEADVAAAHVGSQSQRPNPTLSFFPQRVANPESGVSPWVAAVQLDWPIETAGKRARRRAAAQARASAADLAVGTVVGRLRSDVYEAVAGDRAAAQRAASLARCVELRSQRLVLLERRRALGEIAQVIVAPERIALARATGDQAAAERVRGEARAALAARVGTPSAALDAVEIAFDLDLVPAELEALDGARARRAALLGRSDVLASLAEYDAAEADLRLELAKQYPDLHIGPGYEFDQGADKWGLGVSLELPVVSRNQGGIDEALARRAEAAARFDALQTRVIGEVDAAAAALDGARREAASARRLREQAEQGEARAQDALDKGAADRLGLLDAELESELAAVALVDAQEGLHRALAKLARVTELPEEIGAPR